MAETLDLSDFRGGVKDGTASTEFSRRQWTRLSGVMFEPDGRIRSQWGGRQTAPLEGPVLTFDGLVAGVDGAQVAVFELPDDGADQGAASFGTVSASGVRPLTVVPWLAGGRWTSAGLFASGEDGTEALVVYRDGGTLKSEVLTSRYPTSHGSGQMPYANVAATWGDFLVLGDVRWNVDPDSALSSSNATRRGNALWYSEPAKSDSFDPIDVQFVGQANEDHRIVGLFPVDIGLLVMSTEGVFLFRGTPSQSEYEELRFGIGPQAPEHVAYWPTAGAVVWTDEAGRVWHTNGQEFGRLDRPLASASEGGPVGAAGDNVFAVRDGRLWCFHLEGEDGAWTELVVPGGGDVTAIRRYRNAVYLSTSAGLVRMSPELPWNGAGPTSDALLPVEVVTATLAMGDGHQRAFWHRFGVAAKGPGRVVEAEARPGPWGAGPVGGTVYDRPLGPDGRMLRVWPAPGPSVEATFGVRGEGDVTVEGMTVWAHRGRAERG